MEWLYSLFIEHSALQAVVVLSLISAIGLGLGRVHFWGVSWRVTYEDKEWIDESGKASDTSATIYMDAGCWNFDGATQRPSQFSLMREPQQPVTKSEQPEGGILYDFGKETFGFITLKNLSGKGKIEIYYGESPEEAKDKAYCETLDKLLLS